MEETDVVITGGGPSGLALSVALSHRHIKNIVLELNDEICEDPRAIAVTGDTSRILRVLGVTDDDLSKIGQGSSLKLSDLASRWMRN
jgi:2-polyprenyl-6-methoxyphenol hydroxylase-like FAD-dependent oxidoreductase